MSIFKDLEKRMGFVNGRKLIQKGTCGRFSHTCILIFDFQTKIVVPHTSNENNNIKVL